MIIEKENDKSSALLLSSVGQSKFLDLVLLLIFGTMKLHIER
jgi:hypothetical protein